MKCRLGPAGKAPVATDTETLVIIEQTRFAEWSVSESVTPTMGSTIGRSDRYAGEPDEGVAKLQKDILGIGFQIGFGPAARHVAPSLGAIASGLAAIARQPSDGAVSRSIQAEIRRKAGTPGKRR